MPERNIDISRGFNIGQQMAPGPSPLASIGGGLAGGILDRFVSIQQAKQQAELQHQLSMKYDPKYRFLYNIYSQLNAEQMPSQPVSQPAVSRFSVNPKTGFAEGDPFAQPGQSTSDMTGTLPPGFLRQAAMGSALGFTPPAMEAMKAQAIESGRLAGLYGNPQEAALRKAQMGGEEVGTALKQQQSLLLAHPWRQRLGVGAPASPFEPVENNLLPQTPEGQALLRRYQNQGQ